MRRLALLAILLASPAAAKTKTEYLAQIAATKTGYLDALWDAGDGRYEDGGEPFTWLNAYMVQIIAIQAGQGVASAADKTRANTVVAKLVSAPAWKATNTWPHKLDGTSDVHAAVDSAVAEALYYAYKYRTELGLDSGDAATAYDILTVNREITETSQVYGAYQAPGNPYVDYTLDVTNTSQNQVLSKWQFLRVAVAKLVGAAGYDDEIRTMAERFNQHMDTAWASGQYDPIDAQLRGAYLFPDFGWDYWNGSTWQSFEYGAMTFGGHVLYYPELDDAMALTAGEVARVKAWGRHILGMWQRNGYPNWDTSYSADRLHTLSYWTWSLRSLTAMVRAPELTQGGATDSAIAKAILDNAIDTYASMDTWQADADDDAVPSFPYGTAATGAAGADYNFSKAASNARFMSELAVAVDTGAADVAPASDPGNIWGWGWYGKHLHVSTPYYDAASLPWAPADAGVSAGRDVELQHWGVSRISTPSGRILTALGGYQREAFSFLVSRSGTTDIDTGDPAGTQPTQYVFRDGVSQTRASYDTTPIPSTFSSVHEKCTRAGTNYRVDVETTFLTDRIRTVHKTTLTGAAGPAVQLVSIPAVDDVVVDYVAADDAETVVWDGETITTAASPAPSACKYIHMKWAAWNAGLLIVPRSATVGEGAKVTVGAADPSGTSDRQPAQDRTLLIYLSDTTVEDVGGLQLTADLMITDGTDADALAKYRQVIYGLPSTCQ